jgi:hypothetical protein
MNDVEKGVPSGKQLRKWNYSLYLPNALGGPIKFT